MVIVALFARGVWLGLLRRTMSPEEVATWVMVADRAGDSTWGELVDMARNAQLQEAS